jgi:hypothetical protein
MKRVYEPRLRKAFSYRKYLLDRVRRQKRSIAQGDRIELSLHIGGNQGIGWTTETGSIGAAGYQETARAFFNWKIHWARVGFTESLLASLDSDTASVARPFRLEMDNLMRDIDDDSGFEVYGDGSGLRATVAAAGGGYPVLTGGNLQFKIDKNRYHIRRNMRIDALDSNGNIAPGGFTAGRVLGYDAATKVVTMEGDPSGGTAVANLTSTAKLYRDGSRNKVFMGLDGIVATTNPAVGNYGGVDRAAAGNEYWKAQVFNNATLEGGVAGTPEPITYQNMQIVMDEVEHKSDGRTNLILCSYGVHRALIEKARTDKRFPGSVKEFQPWGLTVMFGETPVIKDRFCPANTMFFLDTDSFTLYEDENQGSFMDRDGAMLKWVPNTLQYTAVWRHFCELICENPNRNGRLDDVKEDDPGA